MGSVGRANKALEFFFFLLLCFKVAVAVSTISHVKDPETCADGFISGLGW